MHRNFIVSNRWLISGAALLAGGAALLFWFFGRSEVHPVTFIPSTPEPAATPAPYFETPSHERVPVVAPLQTPFPTIVRPAPVATPVAAPSFVPAGTTVPPEEMRATLMSIHTMFSDFRTIAGENPVGTNAEIMKAVMGDNKKGAKLGPPPGLHLNAEGELLDPWGTPYFFHQISGQELEIRSAGPDRKMWTDDDQILK